MTSSKRSSLVKSICKRDNKEQELSNGSTCIFSNKIFDLSKINRTNSLILIAPWFFSSDLQHSWSFICLTRIGLIQWKNSFSDISFHFRHQFLFSWKVFFIHSDEYRIELSCLACISCYSSSTFTSLSLCFHRRSFGDCASRYKFICLTTIVHNRPQSSLHSS